MKKRHARRTVAAAAAAAVTLAVLVGVVAIADHEKEQAVLLTARINPQALAASGVDIRR
jgi:negative regulator of sigma E activity